MRRAHTSTPNTWFSTMSGAMTIDRRPGGSQPLRKGKGNLKRRPVHRPIARRHSATARWRRCGTSSCSTKPSLSAKPLPAAPSTLTVSDLRGRVVQQKAAKIDRQILLQAAEHDLKDARQVLALARCARDVLQQTQAAELSMQFAFGLLNLREHLIEGVGKQVEFVSAGAARLARCSRGARRPPGSSPQVQGSAAATGVAAGGR